MRQLNSNGKLRKQTEIGEIPENWKVVELGQYTELVTKGSSPKWQGFNYCDKGILFVRSQNVGLGQLELGEMVYLPKEFNKKQQKSILQKNDLLINIVGSIGRAALANEIVEGGNVNQAVAVARLKQGVEPFFVMAFLLTSAGQFQLDKKKKEIARANLSLQDIKNLLLPLPPLPEQRAIAHILQSIQEAKAACQREIELERERKAALMDFLFSHGARDESRKQTEIGEIPDSWEVVRMGQFCRVYSGYAFKTSDYTKKGIPIIKIGNLQNGEVVLNPDNDCVQESWQQKKHLQKFMLKSKDILIALTGATTGKTAAVPPSLAGTFLNQRVGKIEVISPHAENNFISVVIKTKSFQEAIQQNILRSAQGNISPSSISQISIPCPPLPEQRAIAGVFKAIDERVAALEEEGKYLDELFHTMLDELMTGKRSAVPLIDAE